MGPAAALLLQLLPLLVRAVGPPGTGAGDLGAGGGAGGNGLGDSCASQCSCKWRHGKQTAECAGKGLAALPADLPPETQVLEASGNELKQLPGELFSRLRLANLQRLHLRNCRLERVDARAFLGLTNLVELDLGHNRLQRVPSASLRDVPSLRELSLAHNPLGRLDSGAFEDARNLVKLDLTGCQIKEVAVDGFRGLEALESLKLAANRLTTFYKDTFRYLNRTTGVELHGNPWVCDCHLREMKVWLVRQNLPTPIAPKCQEPASVAGRSFAEMQVDEFACPPVLMLASRYSEAAINENASIVCTVSAIPPARVKWLWNGRQLSNHSQFGAQQHQRVVIYETGSFRKTSTLVLTHAQEADSSSEFFCVAENLAGSVEANFTLHVSLRTAGVSGLGSGQIAGISAALLVLIIAILLTLVALFARLRRTPRKDLKSPTTTTTTTNNTAVTGSNATAATSTTTTMMSGLMATSTNLGPPGAVSVPLTTSTASLTSRALAPTSGIIGAGGVLSPESNHHPYHFVHHQEPPRAPPPPPAPPDELLHHQHQPGEEVSVDNPDILRHARAGLVLAECLAREVRREQQLHQQHQHQQSPVPGASPLLGLGGPSSGSSSGAGGLVVAGASVASAGEPGVGGGGFPAGARQLRVWQRTQAPVLPPVSALKRVLGSTRSSPDEGYQEGTGTDV